MAAQLHEDLSLSIYVSITVLVTHPRPSPRIVPNVYIEVSQKERRLLSFNFHSTSLVSSTTPGIVYLRLGVGLHLYRTC